jgi:hypothetical protein
VPSEEVVEEELPSQAQREKINAETIEQENTRIGNTSIPRDWFCPTAVDGLGFMERKIPWIEQIAIDSQ